jgi:NitT/TauT family transport system permease protein
MTKTASASMPAALKGLGLTKFLLFAAGCVLVGQLVLPPERAELVFLLLVPWLAAWALNIVLARRKARYATYLVPVIFGASLLFLWQTIVRGFDVPLVILPAPTAIGSAFIANIPILWADFVQTVLKSVLPGYAMGCGAAFLTAVLIDRSPFLQRGLLPVGNLAAALPIVGIAPIMVMWFGFDWHSKAAVVVVMCFFPMLVNTLEGLRASDAMQRGLMRTYAASYAQTLLKLRLPAAFPFVFNGLKLCTTLALIGAIVAEFFGTPTVGMGFRISTEIGRMSLDMVWAEIAVAALAGSAFYGAISLLERAVTFWHPSISGSA